MSLATASQNEAITIFRAKRILTMNPAQPEATHVAVREGRILGVGSAADLSGWGPAQHDDRYADNVLMPGLVEGHCHLTLGGLWKFVYCGYYDRYGPDGKRWEGLKDFDAVVQRLADAEARLGPGEPLMGWGFDPVFFQQRMTVRELDRVSASRPVVVMHANMHLMNINTPTLEAAGIDPDADIDGITRFDNGEPTGELREFAAMFPVMRLLDNPFRKAGATEEGLRMFGKLARIAGVTTATDMVNELTEDNMRTLARVTAEPDFPVRILPGAGARYFAGDPAACVRRIQELQQASHDKLRFGMVKIIVDGSIQGFTARLRWPGYYNGAANGIWVTAPAALHAMVDAYHAAGVQMHIHTNGDEATDVTLDAIEAALRRHPQRDHRHTLQHCQMADPAQFRRMASLGLCVNLFVNQVFYWGDVHHDLVLGPDRANRMNGVGTAHRMGVPYAIHSDAPVTPLGPLFTAWCAVNRQTVSGRTLGASERISVADALHAITLGAAYTLRQDHAVGSIEIGKHADFCVLDEDPLEVDPMRLKDLRIAGTVIGGHPLPPPEED